MKLTKTSREDVYDSIYLEGHNPVELMAIAVTHPSKEIIVGGDREVNIPPYVFKYENGNWYHNEEETNGTN